MKSSKVIYNELTLTYIGQTNTQPTVTDLTDGNWVSLNLEASVVTSDVAPVNGRSIAVYYAFSNNGSLTLAGAPDLLENAKRAFTLPLAGFPETTKQYSSDPIHVLGDYLYTWISHGALGTSGANVLLSLTAVNVGEDESQNVAVATAVQHIPPSSVVPTVIAARPARRGMTVYNKTDKPLYLAYAATVTGDTLEVELISRAYWEMPPPIWKGQVALLAGETATGLAHVTELY
jgi:hypothetical protein